MSFRMSRMVTIISAFAQLERDQLSERTRAGMAVAAANGRKAGRREVTPYHGTVKRAHELKAQGLKPADIGRSSGHPRHRLPIPERGRQLTTPTLSDSFKDRSNLAAQDRP